MRARSPELDRRQRRSRWRRIRRVRMPQPHHGSGQPVLEGQPGIPMQFADGTLAEGPIATCEIQGYVYDAQRRCARLAREVWHDETLAENLRAARRRSAGEIPSRLLDARARLPRPGARRQQTSSGQPDLQYRPPPVVRNPGPHRGRRRSRAATRRAAVLRLGRAHARGARGRLQPARLPHRDRLAARKLADCRRPGPIWTPRGGRPGPRRRSSTPHRTSSIACPRSSPASPGR